MTITRRGVDPDVLAEHYTDRVNLADAAERPDLIAALTAEYRHEVDTRTGDDQLPGSA